ncbi:helix-turn-helix domain-containing protein [Propionispora vibrioides]|uniref:Cro/C1-type HTH DNA-binding domain-containing protein n=1 Tax=Propionispora vibrioides TaxID=112903 RepID=A0A1H8UMG2_9FIRM|nr:helix-turn-helix transcriptional regulator [Propionispora vibrioides]SEP04074.1 Cro/C1-type HTH DNA-binding domain-containing protein [Propionispora vibrioides]
MSDLGNKEIMSKNLKFYMEKYKKDRNQVCNDLGFKYSTFTDWVNGNKYPRIDKIEMLANYFGIQKSDLIEEKKETASLPPLTAKDEHSIQKRLESLLTDLMPGNSAIAYYDGEEPMSEDDKELLRISLENTLRLAKQMAKQKFTPKKYRK